MGSSDAVDGRAGGEFGAAVSQGHWRLLMVVMAVAAGCGTGSPFHYIAVSGGVAYEDGSLLPVEQLVLNFHSRIPDADAGRRPPTGTVLVDPRSGRFRTGRSRDAGGVVAGQHRVTLHLPGRIPLPAAVAAEDYCDPTRTPIVVDTNDQPLRIVVVKPK